MATFELGRGSVSRDTGAALHAQIDDAVRSRIRSGEWPPGHRLRPEPALAKEIGVSRGTLRRGLSELIAEGLLTQVPGRGTFVAGSAEPPLPQLLSTIAEDFADQGADLTTDVLEIGYMDARDDVARSLRLADGESVFRMVRLRRTSEGPIALLHNYVTSAVAPGIDRIDFAKVTLFGVLEDHFSLAIDNARRRFSAVSAEPAIAQALEVAPGTALQYFEQLTFLDDGRPIEYSHVWIDSRRLSVVVNVFRHHQRRDT